VVRVRLGARWLVRFDRTQSFFLAERAYVDANVYYIVISRLGRFVQDRTGPFLEYRVRA
jgi:hypothetical protein